MGKFINLKFSFLVMVAVVVVAVAGVYMKGRYDERAGKESPLMGQAVDDRQYQYRVRELEASLAAAKQNVFVLQANVDAVAQSIETAKADRQLAEQQVKRYTKLVRDGAARETTLEEWQDKLRVAQATVAEQEANLRKAQLQYKAQIDGVNTTVAETEAKLAQQQYYLEQTTIYAPEDGFITNLQAYPGLVVGIVRLGAIASFVVDQDPYLLGTYFQEHLKFVKLNQPVEIALDLYPGQIITGTVESIWWATGQGQMIPSGELPTFAQPLPKGRFAVKIHVNDLETLRLPAGAQGAVAIYTDVGKGFAPLRRIVIRTYTWANWLYPLPF